MEQAVRVINVVHQIVIVGLIVVVKQVLHFLADQLHFGPPFRIDRFIARQPTCQLGRMSLDHRFIGGHTCPLDHYSRSLGTVVAVLTGDVHVEAVESQTILVLLTGFVAMTYQTKRRGGIQVNLSLWLALFGATGRLGWFGRQSVGHDLPVSNRAHSAARVPASAFTEVDTTVPDTVAAYREGTALETIDLLDKLIDGCNLAGAVFTRQLHGIDDFHLCYSILSCSSNIKRRADNRYRAPAP